jgi:uncharacterized protein YdhG (YjbR/CyaY superfamily)
MGLWLMDVVGGVRLADGSKAAIVSGTDDHARFVVLAAVVAQVDVTGQDSRSASATSPVACIRTAGDAGSDEMPTGGRTMTDTKRSKKRSASAGTASDGFTEEERAAIKERARELKAAGRGGRKKADDEQAVLDKIAEMPDADRALAERVHAVIAATAPELAPKTWYGMPAYAKDGKIVCFFQGSQKFSSRYSTLGFNDPARLDDGAMWPTAFALVEWTPAVEEKVVELVTTAVG